MFYKTRIRCTDQHDSNPMQAKAVTEVYTDEAMTDKLTEFPSSFLNVQIMVADCPLDSKEAFETYVHDKMMEVINTTEIQDKLNEVKALRDLGLLT